MTTSPDRWGTVERLYHAALAQPFDRRAAVAAAGLVSDVGRSVLSGRRLGAYQILAPIGAGGMGEVYRTRDTRLGRGRHQDPPPCFHS